MRSWGKCEPYAVLYLQVGDLKPTTISLQLTDRSVKYPLSVLEDVPLQVGKFFISYDFVVMEMKEDSRMPIILGRPFLATAGAMIDVRNDKLSLQVADEKVEFCLPQSMASPSPDDTCCRVDILEKADKLDDTLGAYRTTFKPPLALNPSSLSMVSPATSL